MDNLNINNNQQNSVTIDQPTNKTQGFTLIEMMITVALIGIVTAAAWPSFERYQTKNRRTDGIGSLLLNSSRLEKCMINYGAYNNANCDLSTPSKEGYYNITVSALDDTFTLTATPTGPQADDTECANLTLTNLGEKGYTGTAAKIQRCWAQ